MEAARPSEMLVPIYQPTSSHTPEDLHSFLKKQIQVKCRVILMNALSQINYLNLRVTISSLSSDSLP